MALKDGTRVIAIEEHYFDPELAALFTGRDVRTPPPLRARLEDLGAGRIAEMDAAGIDLQVLSHGAPALQKLEGETALRMARLVNDRLHETVRGNPERFRPSPPCRPPTPRRPPKSSSAASTGSASRGRWCTG